MKKITIKQSQSADTRTAQKEISIEELHESSLQHIDDVARVMEEYAKKLQIQGRAHDYTKLGSIDLFHHDFALAQKEGKPFTEMEWYKMHVTTERHHLNNHVPPDVNLFDVLERIADITSAAIARSGKFTFPAEIDADMLKKAYENTIKWTLNRLELQEEKEEAEDHGCCDF